MDNVDFDREAPANLTTMIMAFGGWIDAGRAATGALRHLTRDLRAARLARINPEEFFVFTHERPEVRLTVLDKLCFLPCEEYRDLKRAVG